MSHFEFSFECSETRFHEGVVVAVGGAAHALLDVGASQNRAVTVAGVLAASIGVMNQAVGQMTFTDRSSEHFEDQRFGHVHAEIPADDAS